MSNPRNWRTSYVAALSEDDRTQIPLLVARAEEAIQARLRELPEASSVGSEQVELQSALQNLQRLASA
jgi:hypothetical protein